MSHHGSIHPAYADRFRCIGSACEDTCCQGWNVPIDQSTWDRYQSLPPGPLPDLVRANVVRPVPGAKPSTDATTPFAIIRMNGQNQCPLLNEERLCRIQAELGESLLSHACAVYPRIVHAFGPFEEKALTLSCRRRRGWYCLRQICWPTSQRLNRKQVLNPP